MRGRPERADAQLCRYRRRTAARPRTDTAVPCGASSLGSAFPLIQRLEEIVVALRG
ncbi:hypothetical protein WEH80_33215 [Actinomycetes bacterium KLBMP 9759]